MGETDLKEVARECLVARSRLGSGARSCKHAVQLARPAKEFEAKCGIKPSLLRVLQWAPRGPLTPTLLSKSSCTGGYCIEDTSRSCPCSCRQTNYIRKGHREVLECQAGLMIALCLGRLISSYLAIGHKKCRTRARSPSWQVRPWRSSG